MITEDYVSFEVAKLLKEKGFDEPLYTYYKDGIFTITDLLCKYKFDVDLCRWGNNEYAAPTYQMALRWLREVHNLNVEVYRTACGYVGCIVNIPSGTDIKFLEDDGDDLPSGQYTKWEYACEVSIKYCLTNLIK